MTFNDELRKRIKERLHDNDKHANCGPSCSWSRAKSEAPAPDSEVLSELPHTNEQPARDTEVQSELPLTQGPSVTRIRIAVSRWPNRSKKSQQQLIASKHLSGVNTAIDRYLAFITEVTLPTETPRERWIVHQGDLPLWFHVPFVLLAGLRLDDASTRPGFLLLDESNPINELHAEITKLQRHWTAITAQAVRRANTAGDKIPTGDELWAVFAVDAAVVSNTNTATVLTKFSLFSPAPPSLRDKLI